MTARPQLLRVGKTGTPVVVVDGVTGDPGAIVDLAAALAPFPSAQGSYYPGLRRVITEADGEAMAYVRSTLQGAAPYIGGGFGANRFELIQASFSMVVSAPDALQPPQRAPHFDSPDPDYLAVLHYLSDTAGTAFYRQRATGIEVVTPANVATFVARAQADSAGFSGYIAGSNAAFEQIATVEGRTDRLVIYPGRLLHSGVIPPDMGFSADPRTGRLTANFFIQAKR